MICTNFKSIICYIKLVFKKLCKKYHVQTVIIIRYSTMLYNSRILIKSAALFKSKMIYKIYRFESKLKFSIFFPYILFGLIFVIFSKLYNFCNKDSLCTYMYFIFFLILFEDNTRYGACKLL